MPSWFVFLCEGMCVCARPCLWTCACDSVYVWKWSKKRKKTSSLREEDSFTLLTNEAPHSNSLYPSSRCLNASKRAIATSLILKASVRHRSWTNRQEDIRETSRTVHLTHLCRHSLSVGVDEPGPPLKGCETKATVLRIITVYPLFISYSKLHSAPPCHRQPCVFTSVKGWKLTLMLIWAEYTRCCSLFYANTHNISSVSMQGHTQQHSGLCSGHVFKLDFQQDIRAMDTNHRSG